MKKVAIVILTAVLVLSFCSTVNAVSISEVMKKAMVKLPFEKGDKNLLIMTNLGYSENSQIYYDDFVKEVLKLNLSLENNVQFVHSCYKEPLWFAFFNKSNGECLYMRISGGKIVKVTKANISADELLSKPEEFNAKMRARIFDGNEFSIITIANVWASGMSWELKKSAEFHNHVCPGLISGVMIADYLKKEMNSSNYCIVLATPVWCKDDALQVIFDSTVGKRRMFARQLSSEQKKSLPSVFKNIAGVCVFWNRSEGKGTAYVLAFNWDQVCMDSGVKESDLKNFSSYKWWWARLKMDLEMLKFINQPERYVQIVNMSKVNYETLQKLETAGENPLEVLGIEKQSNKSAPFPIEALVAGVLCAYVVRRRKT